jgi:hypothetical protein
MESLSTSQSSCKNSSSEFKMSVNYQNNLFTVRRNNRFYLFDSFINFNTTNLGFMITMKIKLCVVAVILATKEAEIKRIAV